MGLQNSKTHYLEHTQRSIFFLLFLLLTSKHRITNVGISTSWPTFYYNIIDSRPCRIFYRNWSEYQNHWKWQLTESSYRVSFLLFVVKMSTFMYCFRRLWIVCHVQSFKLFSYQPIILLFELEHYIRWTAFRMKVFQIKFKT